MLSIHATSQDTKWRVEVAVLLYATYVKTSGKFKLVLGSFMVNQQINGVLAEDYFFKRLH